MVFDAEIRMLMVYGFFFVLIFDFNIKPHKAMREAVGYRQTFFLSENASRKSNN